MAGPSVSVVIPCFQAQSTIALQLASLSDQVDAPPFEVILVDNDPAQRLEKAAADFLHSNAFELRIVPAHEHQGSSYARNVGIPMLAPSHCSSAMRMTSSHGPG